MQTAREMSNAFLTDRVRAKDRMKALTATTHIIEDQQIEVVAYWVVLGIVWSVVAVVWVMA